MAIETRKCEGPCGLTLPITKFKAKRVDGVIKYYRRICKSCMHQQNKKNPTYMMGRMLVQAKARCKDLNDPAYGGKGIKYLIPSNQAFYDKFFDDTKKLMDQGITPSINRKDVNGHYELDNIEIISFEQNTAEARDNLSKKFLEYRERPFRDCLRCKKNLPKESFGHHKIYPDGSIDRYTECYDCYKITALERGYAERVARGPVCPTCQDWCGGLCNETSGSD